MELPKVNQELQKSKVARNKLALAIYKAIEEVEKDNDYEFESFEVDEVLLDMVRNTHQNYIKTYFNTSPNVR